MFRNNDLDLTDIGLGNGLATLHNDRLRYIADADKWAVWTGKRWKLDSRNVRFELAKAYVETLDDAVDAQEDDKARKAAAAALNRARSVSGLSAALKSASTVPAMATERKDWDNDPALLLTPDGVVDLRTGTSRPATPDDLMLRAASCAPGGDCPRWLQFLDEICTGDAELVAYLRACVGMSLYGEQRDQVVLICLGIGANGKSTFLDVLHEVFGELSRVAMPDLITAKRNDAHPTEIADLFGARLVICTEAKDGAIDESKIKRLTGGGTITARGIGQDPREDRLRMTLWVDGNAEPRIYGTDEGIWRRIKKLPFRAHFPAGDPRRDPMLREKLMAERSGILAWAIDACRDYLRDGLPACAAVDEATIDYRREQDILAEWLDVRCILDPREEISSAELWADAREWLEEAGTDRGWSQRRLTSELKKRNKIEPVKGTNGQRRLRGIGLRGHEIWGRSGRSKLGGDVH